jgi:hypothetical protein
VRKRLSNKHGRLSRGSVFSLGSLDAFGVCITEHGTWASSALMVDKQRMLEPGYISIDNIVVIKNHGFDEHSPNFWEHVAQLDLGSEWHDPLHMFTENTAFTPLHRCPRRVLGEDIETFRLTCDQNIFSSLFVTQSLCKAVLSADPLKARYVISPFIHQPLPDGFVAYCTRTRGEWVEIQEENNLHFALLGRRWRNSVTKP